MGDYFILYTFVLELIIQGVGGKSPGGLREDLDSLGPCYFYLD